MAGRDETFHIVKRTIYQTCEEVHAQSGLLIAGSALESLMADSCREK